MTRATKRTIIKTVGGIICALIAAYAVISASQTPVPEVRVVTATAIPSEFVSPTQPAPTLSIEASSVSLATTPSMATTPTTIHTVTPEAVDVPVEIPLSRDSGVELFREDFENGSHNWRTDVGTWEIRSENDNQFLCVRTDNGYGFASPIQLENWEDFTLEMDAIIVTSATDNGAGQVLIRFNDFVPTYAYSFRESYSEFGKTVSRESGYKYLGDSSLGLGSGQWSHVRIEVVENQLTLSLNGIQALGAVDSEASVDSGSIALGAGIGVPQSGVYWEVCYDNILVSEN